MQQRWTRTKRKTFIVDYKRVGTVENKGGNRREETIMTRLRIRQNKLDSTIHTMGKHPTGFVINATYLRL